MKVCVIGVGAVGGWIAAKLANAGESVSVLARGQTLRVIREHGLTLFEGDLRANVNVAASEDSATLGVQDLIVVAVKAPALASVAAQIAPMLHERTMIFSAMNGVPTWFFARADRPLLRTALRSIDADGSIANSIDPARTIGCVVHAACSVDSPGVIRNKMGNKLIIGEAIGGDSTRLRALSSTLTNAGFEAVQSVDIQRDIWFKLWGNMTMNPISALTGATCDRILDDDLVRSFTSAVMLEAQSIGRAIGIDIPDTPEARHAVTRKLGAFKTSMLQDVEAGKGIELDALVNVVREIGAKLGIATPCMDALFGLTRLMAQSRGLY